MHNFNITNIITPFTPFQHHKHYYTHVKMYKIYINYTFKAVIIYHTIDHLISPFILSLLLRVNFKNSHSSNYTSNQNVTNYSRLLCKISNSEINKDHELINLMYFHNGQLNQCGHKYNTVFMLP